jgi:hypothetical protein
LIAGIVGIVPKGIIHIVQFAPIQIGQALPRAAILKGHAAESIFGKIAFGFHPLDGWVGRGVGAIL